LFAVTPIAFPLKFGHNSAEETEVSVRLPSIAGFWLVLAALIAGCGGGGGTGTRSGDDVWLNTSPAIYTKQEAQQRAKWTVMVYLDADNDLESAGIHNFNQMEAVGSTQDVHVIVQMDRRTGSDPDNESWTDTRRYLITRDANSKVMHSLRLDDPPLGECDMGSAETLRLFVSWAMSNFPADHYLLIIWDHGTGWQTRALDLTPKYKYIAADDTSSNQMNITDIPTALAGFNVDVLAFDACYMQQLEVAYELRNSADYMVASTSAEPTPGYNYSRLLSQISRDTSPKDLSRIIVQQYAAEYAGDGGITLSAVDMSKVSNVAGAASAFAGILSANADALPASLADARTHSLDYTAGGTRRYSLDLLDYTSRCADVIGNDASGAYADLEAACGAAVIASIHSPDLAKAHGLAIYVPSPSRFDGDYETLALAHDTLWDEWLRNQRQ